MDAKTGFATLHSNQLRFEILEQLLEDRKFTVTLYAVDDSGGTSQRPVVLELTAPPDGEPAESLYGQAGTKWRSKQGRDPEGWPKNGVRVSCLDVRRLPKAMRGSGLRLLRPHLWLRPAISSW